MANVYSQVLVSVHNVAIGSPVLPPVVPTGYIWVIRDIVAWNGTAVPGWTNGFWIADSDAVPIWATPNLICQTQRMYHTELRQVLATGHELIAHTLTANWNLRISGYALTTP